jgi:hypothetical protein
MKPETSRSWCPGGGGPSRFGRFRRTEIDRCNNKLQAFVDWQN